MSATYRFDFVNNTLVCSKSFLKKASIFGSAEYKILINCRNDNPGMTIVESKTSKKASKYKNLTYEKMASHIVNYVHNKDKKAAEADLAELEKHKVLAEIQSNPYKMVYDWFVSKYPEVRKAAEEETEESV